MKELLKIYAKPAFLICVATLAAAGGGMSLAIDGFASILKKSPLPLKKSLEMLDEGQLGPYKVVSKDKIENEEIVESLGTKDYIKWTLEDTQVAADSAMRSLTLFITYYRLPDRVPHVPEECYTGGGYRRLATERITFGIDHGSIKKDIGGRYLVFGSTSSDLWNSAKFPVLYFFNVNGKYAASRNEARMALNKNLFGRYSYFCKVELVFNQQLGANKEDAIRASEKLLGVLLPILETEHWPDWKNLKGN